MVPINVKLELNSFEASNKIESFSTWAALRHVKYDDLNETPTLNLMATA